MFVKSLTLKGFKSFADAVTLDLRPGVNVVVGPNGSGKSNVIDAVAWVLGAQGASKLRGGKMDDVIFAGTGKRAALGRAEVALTIDNSDGAIPVEFNEVTITRTLFRTGESEYAINGVQCRLLDIQELLSDSGVGRQQHVIVSQGNLDAILTARPEDRRAVVEEAAGVLKYRKRRERSQRRLEGTEQNLERLQDLVREVRQQLRPLQKQAESAQRHEEVVVELRNLKLYTAGRDIESLRHRQSNAEADNAQFAETEAELRAQLEAAIPAVEQAEATLASFHGDDLGDQVEKLERLSQRAKGLGALLTERTRSAQRDLESQVSQDVVAQLESDAVNVGRELVDVEEQKTQLAEPLAAVEHQEAEVGAAWLEFEEEWGEGLPVASNEAAQIRGQLSSLKKNADSLGAEHGKRTKRDAEVRNQLEQLDQDADAKRRELAEAEGRQDALQLAVDAAVETSGAGVETFEDARTALQAGEHRSSVAAARHEALTSALDAARAKAGVERLSELNGIVGTLAEMVEIDEGYELAFEAAAGDANAAVIVDSIESARAALSRLGDDEANGAVLVLGQEHDHNNVPKGKHITALRSKVRGNNDEINDLLDRVICCASVVDGGWEQAVDLNLKFPNLVFVTKAGDRFSRSGWRLGTAGTGATAAAVEQSANDVAAAQEALAELQEAVSTAQTSRDEMATVERNARAAFADNEKQMSEAARNLDRAESRAQALRAELESVSGSIEELSGRLNEEQQQMEQLQLRLPMLEAAEASGEERARLWREARGALEDRSTEIRKERSRLEVLSRSLDERHEFLVRRRDGLLTRVEQHKVEVAEAAVRRERIEHSIGILGRLLEMVASRSIDVEQLLAEVRTTRDAEREKRRAITKELEIARRRKSEAESKLLENGEAKQQYELRLAELRVRLEGVLETLATELEVDEETAVNASEPELPEGKTAKGRTADLERELRQMGPINPLALEEFNSVRERHEFLNEQMNDVQESRRELLRVIKAVDTEIQETFRSAFADVSMHFQHLFGSLFPGGSGNLRLTDPENPLETGIEIEAKPSGKNVRTLSLLSGGERSLAAMAFLFAVFRSRPSPFYLLDEVEAPLDDMNLSRFLTLVEEFRTEAQLVIVSHQKRTMEVADTLYGVSMQAGGSSKVVSQKNEILDLTEQPA